MISRNFVVLQNHNLSFFFKNLIIPILIPAPGILFKISVASMIVEEFTAMEIQKAIEVLFKAKCVHILAN